MGTKSNRHATTSLLDRARSRLHVFDMRWVSGKAVIVTAFVVTFLLLAWQCFYASPTNDELAHLTAGLYAVQKGDFGFFAVNPPIYRLWSAVIVDAVYAPALPPVPDSSVFGSIARPEFELGRKFAALNPERIIGCLTVARLSRIPVVLLGGWLIACFFPARAVGQRSLAALLWLTSPLVLGHGWIVSADAFSGVAGAALVLVTTKWLRSHHWVDSVIAGIVWGIAIGIKFTFCALFAAFPVAYVMYVLASGGPERFRRMLVLFRGHVFQGFVALIVVMVAYGFSRVGVTLDDHHFHSPTMSRLSEMLSWPVGSLRSPFPQAFLTGIDSQLLDMDQPRGTYLAGNRIEGKVPWFYLVSYPAKEQIVVWGLLLLSPIALFRLFCSRLGHSPAANPFNMGCSFPEFAFVFSIAMLVLGILSSNSNLVWNTRYLFPGIPALLISLTAMFHCLAIARFPLVRAMGLVMIAVELMVTFPYYYSYVNPILGGSYRNPFLLHDSNFDYGQDLWYVDHWIRSRAWHRVPDSSGNTPTIFFLGYVPNASVYPQWPPAPKHRLIIDACAERASGNRDVSEDEYDLIVISRVFRQPVPWNLRYATSDEINKMIEDVQQLLNYQPDEFITPTHGVYRVHRNTSEPLEQHSVLSNGYHTQACSSPAEKPQ